MRTGLRMRATSDTFSSLASCALLNLPVHHQCLVTVNSLCFNAMSSTSHHLNADTRCARKCNLLRPMFQFLNGMCLAFSLSVGFGTVFVSSNLRLCMTFTSDMQI